MSDYQLQNEFDIKKAYVQIPASFHQYTIHGKSSRKLVPMQEIIIDKEDDFFQISHLLEVGNQFNFVNVPYLYSIAFQEENNLWYHQTIIVDGFCPYYNEGIYFLFTDQDHNHYQLYIHDKHRKKHYLKLNSSSIKQIQWSVY